MKNRVLYQEPCSVPVRLETEQAIAAVSYNATDRTEKYGWDDPEDL